MSKSIYNSNNSKDVVVRTTSMSYWKYIWKILHQSWRAKISLRIVYLLIFIAVFGDFIANERPLICKVDQVTYFPVFHQYLEGLDIAPPYKILGTNEWNELEYDYSVFPLIPYSNSSFDLENIYKSPFGRQNVNSLRKRHWLGTSDLGKDVFAGLIYGTRIALLVGLLSMLIAGIIGIFFGLLAGYFGDSGIQVSRVSILLHVLGFIIFIVYGFLFRKIAFQEGQLVFELLKSLIIGVVIFVLVNISVFLFEKNRFLGKKVNLPLDILLQRLIEIINSIPILLILFAALSIINSPSIFNIILIVGLFRWTGVARFLRAELLKVRSMEYIKASKSIGLSNYQIIMKHALPNAISPILIIIAFGISGVILLEASLSFLGIGVDPNEVTWGQLLSFARTKPSAWWLAVFPGLAIFITVTVFNLIGDALSDVMDIRR